MKRKYYQLLIMISNISNIMSFYYYSQIIPSELRELLLYYISGYELIDVCGDTNSIFYHHICKNIMFWKEKVLTDFPIDAKEREITYLERDSQTNEHVEKTYLSSRYDIFKSVKNYDVRWLYNILCYYFNGIKPESKRPIDDLFAATLDIFQYSGKHPSNIKLLKEIMKNPTAVSWLMPKGGIKMLEYIYKNYPHYRKVVLISLLFTNRGLASKFQQRLHPQETFTFSELEKIMNSTLAEDIINDEIEDFNEVLINKMIPEVKSQNELSSTEKDDTDDEFEAAMKNKVTKEPAEPED